MDSHQAPAYTVERVVIEGDRRRRRVAALAALAWLAPRVASAVLVLAVVGWFLGWPALLVLGTIVCLGVGLGLTWVWLNRPHAAGDLVAAEMDRDADCAGELRSAHWFARRVAREGPGNPGDSDAWAAFHLERAAIRMAAINWATVYPVHRRAGAWWGTAALCLVAVVFAGQSARTSLAWPVRSRAIAAQKAAGDAEAPASAEEIRASLAALTATAALSEADSKLLEDAVARLEALALRDPALRETLNRILKAAPRSPQVGPRSAQTPDLKGLIGSAEEALSIEEKWALDDLAARLADVAAKQSDAESGAMADAADGDKPDDAAALQGGADAKGQTAAEKGQPSGAPNSPSSGRGQASVQQMREAVARGGAQAFLGMAGSGAGSGPMSLSRLMGQARGGVTSVPLDVASALAREVVEASVDVRGANVKSARGEDPRREGQQDASRLDYTGVTPRSSDRTRADAPPQVPEERRPQLERYFVRPSTPN